MALTVRTGQDSARLMMVARTPSFSSSRLAPGAEATWATAHSDAFT